MKHQAHIRKFGRNSSARRAMFRSLATSFLLTERFETTVQKAKDLRPIVEKLITLGREDTLHHRRQAYSYLLSKEVVHKLFAEIGPRFLKVNGGYTRIVRTRYRHGDAAQLAVIELCDVAGSTPVKSEKKTPAKKKAAPKKAASKAKAEGAAEEKPKKAAKATKAKKKSE